MPIKSTKNFALHQSNNFIWTAMREKSASRTLSGSIGNLVDPVLDLNDEQKLLQYLPHVSKYQDDMFSGRSLPVPPLDRTLPKYLRTLQPILDHKQMEKAKKIASETSTDTVVQKCQKYLEERAQKSPNWLADWWLNAAYLSFRESVVINVSPAFVFRLPPFPNVHSWIECATQLACGQHMAIQHIQSPEFVDSFRKTAEKSGDGVGPCLIQYYRLFNACRVPREGVDGYVVYPNGAPNGPTHIVVMCQNKMYSVDILDRDRKLLSGDEIFKRLMGVYMSSCLPPETKTEAMNEQTPDVPIGILTSQHRDTWTDQYTQLASDPHNREVLRTIESSIFMLCLDYDPPENESSNTRTIDVTESREKLSELSGFSLHGGGSNKHSCNRWFDKTIQVIVGMSDYLNVLIEHSGAEGTISSLYTALMREYAKDVRLSASVAVDAEECSALVTRLQFNTDVIPDISSAVETAKQHLDQLIGGLDLKVCVFDSFGKNTIKQFQFSPDAFFQVSLQLAMFRYLQDKYNVDPDEQLLVPTYESGSLRNYRWGRTDTIRSATPQALQFARAAATLDYTDPSLPLLLLDAIRAHSEYTREVMKMEGVDRHLLGLKLAHRELASQDSTLKLPQLFKEQFHDYFSEILLSTSQVYSEKGGFTTFGPTSLDCTGVCYNIQSNSILFMVSTFRQSQRTHSNLFISYVERALRTLRDIMQQETPNSKSKL
ncbi:carnitine O-acetyltransferase-like isoform X2 [Symsagittifera roscoffensis]|uniref:carnitine O-acetyltransferase-like isoform X2 n=1 Tax=Symsagittifera roscoffensis TaxID=84072 RepID=UPI00307C9107